MATTDYWIKKLKLIPHPEGGYYKEVYRSGENYDRSKLPGSSLTLYILRGHDLSTQVLGSPEFTDGTFQVVIPANCWFGALVNEPGSYVLSGHTVAPGFDFADFEIAKRTSLLEIYLNMPTL